MPRPKTTIRRLPERSVSETEAIYRILDEGFLCHVGYMIEDRPVVIPTLYGRDRDRIILHGSTGSGITRAVRNKSPLSIAVTIVDALVVARSTFHSSANYRSVVIHGYGKVLEGAEHRAALDTTVEHLLPGRSSDVRSSTEAELRQTASIAVALSKSQPKSVSAHPGTTLPTLRATSGPGSSHSSLFPVSR